MSFVLKSVQHGTRLGGMDVCKRTPKQYILLHGVWGSSPRKKFGFRGRNLCILVTFCVNLLQINTPILPPQNVYNMELAWGAWMFVKKMQLDVDVSPPANIITFRLGSTHLAFGLDPCDL